MYFSELSGPNLIGLAGSVSILLAQDLSSDEINILSSFFCALGDNLALMANTTSSSSQEDTSTSDCNNKSS
jgi:hypothetical protein